MKNIKRRVSLLLLFVMLVSGLPVLASEEMDVSNWARLELLDGERYGLYTRSWYRDGFRQAITGEKVDLLIAKTDEKLGEAGRPRPNFKEIEVGDRTTRGGYLKMLYNVLAKYDDSPRVSKDPIAYLNKVAIVKGNGRDLYLDRKITSEEAIVFSKRAIDQFYHRMGAGAKGLMWEAEKDGNKVYMLGSIHMADSSIYPFSEDIQTRFEEADELFVEVDISNKEDTEKLLAKKMEEMQKKMVYSDGRRLRDDLGEELYGKLKKVMDGYEVEEASYEQIKPWGVIPQLTTLKMMDDMAGNIQDLGEGKEEISDEELEKIIQDMEKAGDPTDYGIDMYFLLKAKEMKKPVIELESMEMQFELLFGTLFANPYEKLGLEEQKQALDKELEAILNPAKETEKPEGLGDLDKQIEDFQAQLKGMLESWRRGDADDLRKILKEASDPNNINASLLGDRDKEMARKISLLLDGEEKKTYFVVVGAAHYVTDGMVIDNLKDMGYKVKSLNK